MLWAVLFSLLVAIVVSLSVLFVLNLEPTPDVGPPSPDIKPDPDFHETVLTTETKVGLAIGASLLLVTVVVLLLVIRNKDKATAISKKDMDQEKLLMDKDIREIIARMDEEIARRDREIAGRDREIAGINQARREENRIMQATLEENKGIANRVKKYQIDTIYAVLKMLEVDIKSGYKLPLSEDIKMFDSVLKKSQKLYPNEKKFKQIINEWEGLKKEIEKRKNQFPLLGEESRPLTSATTSTCAIS
jgi:hypothetical protein